MTDTDATLGLHQMPRSASNGPLPSAGQHPAAGPDGPKMAVRLANRIRTSPGLPPDDSDVVLLPADEALELIRSGAAHRADAARPSWLVMPEPSDWPMRRRQQDA
jgi:hypothetical protein